MSQDTLNTKIFTIWETQYIYVNCQRLKENKSLPSQFCVDNCLSLSALTSLLSRILVTKWQMNDIDIPPNHHWAYLPIIRDVGRGVCLLGLKVHSSSPRRWSLGVWSGTLGPGNQGMRQRVPREIVRIVRIVSREDNRITPFMKWSGSCKIGGLECHKCILCKHWQWTVSKK